MENLSQIISGYESITLQEMDSVELLNRIDTKFVLSISDLQQVLVSLSPHYRALEVNNDKIIKYHTLYFDYPDYKLYRTHQNGKMNRYKVRMRKYVDSDLSFLEVKFKNNKGRTEKYRKIISDIREGLTNEDLEFIATSSQLDIGLEAKVMNKFERVTLVNKTLPERLTIDTNLRFNINGKIKAFPDISIVELKQEKYDRESDFVKLVKSKYIRPQSISKYCLGVGILADNVKTNKIKEKIYRIDKIANLQHF